MRKIFFLVFTVTTLSAQDTLNKQEQIIRRLDKILANEQRILKAQERMSKILEEADAPPPPAKVDVSHSPVLGMDKAPITIVEFTDFQCPYCSKFHTEILPEIHKKFIANGLVRLVSKDFPLPGHKNALQAAEAARCAEDQGHFWEMRDWMQTNPEKLELSDLSTHVQEIGLDLEQYRNCMASAKYRTAIQKEVKEAQKLNISGTPSFVIGKSGPTIEGQLITGAPPYQTFEQKLSELLK